MMRAHRVAPLLFASAVAASACRKSPPPPAPPSIVRFEVAGCAAVLRGGACEVSDEQRTVRIRVTPDDAHVEATWGGAALATRRPEGALVAVEIPQGREDGTLEVTTAKGASRSLFRLAVRRAASEPRLSRVRKLRREGRLADAVAAMPELGAVPPTFVGRAASLQARLDLGAGRAAAAIAGFRAAMALHRRDGRASDEVLDAMALSHTLLSHGRQVAEARAALAAVAEPLADWDEGGAQIGYYRALLDRDTGDLRSALGHLAEAERGSTRLGIADMEHATRVVMAPILMALGRYDEARAMLRLAAAAKEGGSPCRRAEVLATRGWLELTAPEPAVGLAEVARIFDDARDAYETRCPRRADLQNAHVNAALAALSLGELDRAEGHAKAARAMGAPPAWIALWLLDLEGRVALARGEAADALARYDDLDERARDVGAIDARWRALVGRARVLDARRRIPAAIEALREAERLLDERAPAIPLDAGRAGFFGHHGESASLLSELLVRDGRPAEAARVVRRARARAIASADRAERVARLPPAERARWDDAVIAYRKEREALETAAADAWQLATDKLPAARAALREREERARATLDAAFARLGPVAARDGAQLREGELILVYQAFPGGPARLFAEDSGGVTTSAIDLPPLGASPEALARALLAPAEAAIAKATRVRVLATGSILRVDLHALPFQGAPLVARAPVVYAMDLPPAVRASPAPATALVVADPGNDLAAARREVDRVTARLSRAFAVAPLLGDAAERDRVLAALPGATLFHFGGHGVFAGTTGWQSALTLAGTGSLTLGDILTLPAVPRWVVLSGCETGRAPESSSVLDVSLAHAFASAGAEAVVAAVRPVRDDLAAAMAEALYAGVQRGDWDLASALRDASVRIAQRTPDLDWAAYRVVTR